MFTPKWSKCFHYKLYGEGNLSTWNTCLHCKLLGLYKWWNAIAQDCIKRKALQLRNCFKCIAQTNSSETNSQTNFTAEWHWRVQRHPEHPAHARFRLSVPAKSTCKRSISSCIMIVARQRCTWKLLSQSIKFKCKNVCLRECPRMVSIQDSVAHCSRRTWKHGLILHTPPRPSTECCSHLYA